MFQPYLVTNETGFSWEKFELYLISTGLLELLIVEYIHEIDISFYLSLMFIYSSAALKNSSKKKETGIEKEIVEVFKCTSDRRKKAGN